ncbi:hypothetical protein ACQKWADRAFT_197698 [Trichoderma austrokoningii]
MYTLNSDTSPERSNTQVDGAPCAIPATEYSTAWACALSDPEFGIWTDEDLKSLRHVNCSYLSSGRPPTLLALKQHAQALTNLIRKLCGSDSFGLVDGGNKRQPAFEENEAFDWLTNLDTPYTNDDESHHLHLWVLANQIEDEDEEMGVECHCPLKIAEDGESTRRPYSSHQNLVIHANTCLEILDHEYSATGGLLSLLPSGSEEDHWQMEGARNTLLGQWLLHHQHLIGRMHELEISYGQSLDLLKGEAVVPMQMKGRLSPEERAKEGRDLVLPQDRFVLANAGDDVFDMLHHLMDKAESKIDEKEQIWWESGVSGERMWMEHGGGDYYSRGMVPVDLMTRFVRLKDHGDRSTIFILPAIEQHPGTAQTCKIESRPTVVSVATPSWPERASDIEQRANAQMEEMRQLEDANRALARDKEEMEAQMATLRADLRKTRCEVRYYEGTKDEIMAAMAAMRRQMTKLREVLPEEYAQLLEDEAGVETMDQSPT